MNSKWTTPKRFIDKDEGHAGTPFLGQVYESDLPLEQGQDYRLDNPRMADYTLYQLVAQHENHRDDPLMQQKLRKTIAEVLNLPVQTIVYEKEELRISPSNGYCVQKAVSIAVKIYKGIQTTFGTWIYGLNLQQTQFLINKFFSEKKDLIQIFDMRKYEKATHAMVPLNTKLLKFYKFDVNPKDVEETEQQVVKKEKKRIKKGEKIMQIYEEQNEAFKRKTNQYHTKFQKFRKFINDRIRSPKDRCNYCEHIQDVIVCLWDRKTIVTTNMWKEEFWIALNKCMAFVRKGLAVEAEQDALCVDCVKNIVKTDMSHFVSKLLKYKYIRIENKNQYVRNDILVSGKLKLGQHLLISEYNLSEALLQIQSGVKKTSERQRQELELAIIKVQNLYQTADLNKIVESKYDTIDYA